MSRLRVTFAWGASKKTYVREFENSYAYDGWYLPFDAPPKITLIEDMVLQADGAPKWVPREMG